MNEWVSKWKLNTHWVHNCTHTTWILELKNVWIKFQREWMRKKNIWSFLNVKTMSSIYFINVHAKQKYSSKIHRWTKSKQYLVSKRRALKKKPHDNFQVHTKSKGQCAICVYFWCIIGKNNVNFFYRNMLNTKHIPLLYFKACLNL